MVILPIETSPIDTGRSGSPEIRRIFDEKDKLQKWPNVEAAIAKAQAAVGDIPKAAAEEISRNATTKTVTLARVRKLRRRFGTTRCPWS